MKIKQRTLSILLSLTLVLTFIPAMSFEVFADKNNWVPWEDHEGDGYFEEGDLTWNIFPGFGGTDRRLDLEGKCRLYCYAEVYMCEETTTGRCWEQVDEGARKKYRWYRDDTLISGATGKAYVATKEGTYRCDVTVTCEGDKKTDSIIFNVGPLKKKKLSLNASNQVMKSGVFYKIKSGKTRTYRLKCDIGKDMCFYQYNSKSKNWEQIFPEVESIQIELKANRTYYLCSQLEEDNSISIFPVPTKTLIANAKARYVKKLKAKAKAKGRVQLTWYETDDVPGYETTEMGTGYQVYRSTKKIKVSRR